MYEIDNRIKDQRKLKENNMPRKISLKTRTFEKSGDAKKFFSKMLQSYSVGDKVSESDAKDLIALLDRHDEKDEKIGVGISYFEVSLPPSEYPPFTKQCFWIVRADGTKIDISISHCLERKPYD